ncbi:MAG: hypothetical protein COU47_00290 [Candidatus Niyogibacteria bacterium CG10_big_fil_rev_8_21_14_0_10_46_36]|uniref:Penicillin-binding protein transpeptidase domain-containing protein n=1 Tax=Candidatus Niyogibacteria bacterium CG10_big_fil_rev_8_21_14_0_10_46_36 TaxID=1974726 RepID=A0A2H0TFY4_9BACT|nr:MAG: hypothetical protein COU47_00290 [Candidatus Niyogibacteria bacterium CG10_big_fil_rev_8_21_14_0_10_46_36]
MMKSIRGRLVIVTVALTIFAVALVVKLFFIQVISADYYQSLAERQQVASQELSPRRGEVYVHDGDSTITVATTRSGWLLYADARKIEDAEETYGRLSMELNKVLLHIDKERFFAIAQKRDDPFEILIPRIEDDVAAEMDVKEIPGIGLLSREWRYYPLGEFASHVIGFFGFGSDGKEAGQYGIERFYDNELQGKRGIQEGIASSGGTFLNIGKSIFLPPREGDDITLTIEYEVQQMLERAMDDVVQKFSPETAGGVIIDPKTGKILAMAARSNFNPNAYAGADIASFLNPLVSSIYELGSIFKPLTVAAALDAGVVTPETEYVDYGFIEIDGAKISNYDGKARGRTNIQGVLNESLNTGAVFVGQQIGKEKFLDYFERYGFDTKTDIDLPFETVGDISNLETNRDIEYAAASFGQGIAVTPIEFVRAASALANGGYLVTPHIIEGAEEDLRPPKQILSAEASHTISRMLTTVVDKALLGGGQGPEHYSVAAKTGTAQVANIGARGYSGRFLHSFFGYAPSFDPEFLIFLFTQDPKGVQYASHSLGPAFLDLTSSLLYYYEVPPDR